MLPFITLLLFVLARRNLASDDLNKLLKIHPTWSFELMSVETMITEAAESLNALHPKLSEEGLRARIKANFGSETTHLVRKVGDPKWIKSVPASFDAREKWKACASLINDVDDEGACFTDGPVVAASVATDRYCIFTNGSFKERLSAEMMAGCAEFCTRDANVFKSFRYLTAHGTPTGGSYKSNKGCLPYTSRPCLHTNASYFGNVEDKTWRSRGGLGKLKPCEEIMKYDHFCPTECSNRKYGKSLENDLKKFTTWYILYGNEFHIRNEILAYGPVATSIILFDDFFKYPEGGMYKRQDGSQFILWDKYFKLIGWGEENGTKYWLAVNTWDGWGDTKVFKIPRGVNHAYVEYLLAAGVFDDI